MRSPRNKRLNHCVVKIVSRSRSRSLENLFSRSNKSLLTFLPPANEVWGKVICLQVCVCPQGVGVAGPGGLPGPGGAWSRGMPCPGGGGAWSQGGLVPGEVGASPPDGYCCRRYASY